MKIPVLLISTATRWYGTARIPGALAKAGFEVSLLTPRNSLAEKSRFVARVGHLPDETTTMQWVFAFAGMVKAVAPRLVLPCDDIAFRLLQLVVLSPPKELQPHLQLQLASLIRESLGESAHYRTSVDKTLLPRAAEALGVRVPPWAIATTPQEAEATITTLGLPLVLKRGYGFAGHGVAICHDRVAVRNAFAELSQPDALDLEGVTGTRLLAQAHVPGCITYYGIAAWKGTVLAGYATDKVAGEPTGPATVIRYHRAPEIRGIADKLAGGLGMSGLFSLECVVHERTGEAYLLEINRRVSPGTFRGRLLNVDMCAALHAALNGLPSPSRSDLDEGESGVRPNFPQEWLRDPNSRYLRDYPVDVPWEDPELIEAMLALRHEA